MSQDSLLIQANDKRGLTIDSQPSALNRPLPEAEKPLDVSPLHIRIWNTVDLFLRNYLEIQAHTSRRCQNLVASLHWCFAQQTGDNGGSYDTVVNNGQVDILRKTFDGRSGRRDHNHRDENDCRKLPTH
ncbi:hypothetical protein [Mesorhizobium sp.]|uniref:hypothetical protein n=1 Tax=Mesorhizobium sp. TaxID=1871066 RepID=UPI0025D57437|nr:hypothetical protein [Mesorhizobium sp.]